MLVTIVAIVIAAVIVLSILGNSNAQKTGKVMWGMFLLIIGVIIAIVSICGLVKGCSDMANGTSSFLINLAKIYV